MGIAPGIAGSDEPEEAGIFVCPDRSTVDFFIRLNNTGGPVDVWAVDEVEECDLVESSNGFSYLPYRIGRERLILLARSLPPVATSHDHDNGGAAYRSTLTITLDDGTTLRD